MNAYKLIKEKLVLLAFITGVFLCLLFPVSSIAQYTLDKNQSFVKINGTSTLHDWEVDVEYMEGTLQVEVKGGRIAKFNSGSIIIPVLSMKSGKSTMDKMMYKTLNSDDHTHITYKLKGYTIHNSKVTVVGELTVAGVAKKIQTVVNQEFLSNQIKIKGEVNLKMTDFNINPPVLFLGTLKTGDEVLVSFNFIYVLQK